VWCAGFRGSRDAGWSGPLATAVGGPLRARSDHLPLPLVGQVNLTKPEARLQTFHPQRRPPAVIAEQLHY